MCEFSKPSIQFIHSALPEFNNHVNNETQRGSFRRPNLCNHFSQYAPTLSASKSMNFKFRPGPQMPFHKALQLRPNLFLTYIQQAMWLRKTTIIGTRPIRAGLALDPFRRRMQWDKPFRKLRTKNVKVGMPEKAARWPGPESFPIKTPASAISANKSWMLSWCDHFALPLFQPPVSLLWIASHTHRIVPFAQPPWRTP